MILPMLRSIRIKMKKPTSSLRHYQRAVLMCLAVMFAAYAIALDIPISVIIAYLVLLVPGIINPELSCRSIPVLFLTRVSFNYCGAVLPLCAAVLILVHSNTPWYYVLVLTSISTALTSLHTYVTDKLILVNVARYFASFITLSLSVLDMDRLIHVMPFAITVGLIAGSDLIPYIVTSLVNKDRKSISIGGFMALDAISVSLVLALTTLAVLMYLLD